MAVCVILLMKCAYYIFTSVVGSVRIAITEEACCKMLVDHPVFNPHMGVRILLFVLLNNLVPAVQICRIEVGGIYYNVESTGQGVTHHSALDFGDELLLFRNPILATGMSERIAGYYYSINRVSRLPFSSLCRLTARRCPLQNY